MRESLEDLAGFVIARSVSGCEAKPKQTSSPSQLDSFASLGTGCAISVGIASLTSFARNDTPPSTDRLQG